MNIISYSLYGYDKPFKKRGNRHQKHPIYILGAIENAILRPIVYGDKWRCRFYCDESIPDCILDTLIDLDCEIVIKTGDVSEGMFWRFLPVLGDERFIVRDTDSRLSLREKDAVDRWGVSGRPLHLMHDHHCHSGVLAGMWGGYKLDIPDFESKMYSYIGTLDKDAASYLTCQKFLGDCFKRIDATIHEKENLWTFPNDYTSYVGQVSYDYTRAKELLKLRGIKFKHVSMILFGEEDED